MTVPFGGMTRDRMRHPDKNPRILVAVTHPLGGIRTYLMSNVPYLVEAGYSFTFLAPEGEALEQFKKDTKDWRDAEIIGVPVRNGKFRLCPSVRLALRTRRFSLVHSQGLRAGVEVALANLGVGVPHAITLHDVIVPQNDVPGRLKWLKKRVSGWLTRRADAIIAVSEDCAQNHFQHFPEWNAGPCRIEVILNGVNVDQLRNVAAKADRNALRADLGFPADATILGFFGRFMPQKGFLVLLDALRELAQRGCADRVRLVAIKDPHGYRGEYMREVERDSTLAKMVCFIEPVSNIAVLLPQIDVLVMPSLWEAYGLLAAEAMTLGVQVVGSDAIGLREVLRGTPSLAPRAGDAGSLADALHKAILSPWNAEAAAYQAAAGRYFDIAESASRLRRVLEECVAGDRRQ